MSKKKLIITITSLCLVLVAAVAAVVGVVAASQQTVTSSITVNYVAHNVKASVAVSTKSEAESGWTTRGSSVSFNAADASQTKTVNVSDPIALGGRTIGNEWRFERYVVYRYAFTNSYEANAGRAMTVTLTYTADHTSNSNMLVAFAVATTSTEPEVGDMPAADGTIAAWNTTNVPNTAYAAYNASSKPTITVNRASTGYIYVVVAMQDPTLDSSFSVTSGQTAFSFDLVSVLNS